MVAAHEQCIKFETPPTIEELQELKQTLFELPPTIDELKIMFSILLLQPPIIEL
jgi:hypothetical protein